MSTYLMIRWLHILAATAWFGEVVTINVVLVPVVARLPREEGARFLARVFPRIFRLASWLSGTAVVTGAYLAWWRYGSNPEVLWTTWPGRAFSAGAGLGLLLTVFHFILEPRLDGMICSAADRGDLDLSDKVIRLLRIVPRAGLVVIGTALVLMMVGARGI